jgi:MFS transporter, DHA2 family, multidrug resistance protein
MNDTSSAETSETPTDGLPAPRRFLAVVSISLGTVLTTVDGTIANVALPTLARDLHVRPSETVLVVTVYQVVLMMTLLPFSALSRRLGYRATYQLGQATFVFATIFCFLARSLTVLVVARGLQALGAAMILSVSSALIRAVYPLARLGRGLSFNTAIAASSAAVAPTAGGAILAFASWPWLFAIVVPFGVFSLLIGRNVLPEGTKRNEPYDFVGAAMCAATMGLAVSGLQSVVSGDAPASAVTLLALCGVVGWVFVRRELRQPAPVFPIDLLRNKAIALPCVGSLAAYMGMMMLTVSFPFRLQQHYGFTPAAAGAVLAPLPLVSMIVAPTAGLLSDRYPAGILGAIGMAIGVVGMLSLASLPEAPHHIDILWRVTVCGLGFGMFFSPNSRQIMGATPHARMAAAGALFTTIRGAGQTFGATVVAALLAAGVGLTGVPPLIGAGLALIAGVCSVALLR